MEVYMTKIRNAMFHSTVVINMVKVLGNLSLAYQYIPYILEHYEISSPSPIEA